MNVYQLTRALPATATLEQRQAAETALEEKARPWGDRITHQWHDRPMWDPESNRHVDMALLTTTVHLESDDEQA